MSYANCRKVTGGGTAGILALIEPDVTYTPPNILATLTILNIPAGNLKPDFLYQLQLSLFNYVSPTNNSYLAVTNGVDTLATQCTDAGQTLNCQFTIQFIYQGDGSLQFSWINSTSAVLEGTVTFSNVQLTELGEISVI